MSYEMLVEVDGEVTEAYHLGSTTDVDDLVRWLGALPDEPDFRPARDFAETFQTDDGTALALSLGKALAAHPPTVRGVEATVTEVGDTCFGLPRGHVFRLEA